MHLGTHLQFSSFFMPRTEDYKPFWGEDYFVTIVQNTFYKQFYYYKLCSA